MRILNQLKIDNEPDPSVELESGKYVKDSKGDKVLKITPTPIHQNVRVLVFEYGCEFCREWVKVVDRFNQKLDRTATPIRKVDIEGVEPELEMLEPQAAPILYIDGIKIMGITKSSFGKGFLKGYLEDEILI